MSTVYIQTAQDWLDFCVGTYGTGASDDKIVVQMQTDVDLADYSEDYVGMPSTIHCDIHGNGNVIKNAVVQMSQANPVINIGSTSTVENLTFDNISITSTGNDNAFTLMKGGLSYKNIRWKGTCDIVANSYSYGNNAIMSGLASGAILDCIGFSGTVEIAGGFVGFASGGAGTIKNCYIGGTLVSRGDVTLYSSSGDIFNCCSVAAVECDDYRFCSSGRMSRCYDASQVTATGTVKPGSYAITTSTDVIFPHAVYFVTDYFPDFAQANPDYTSKLGVSLANLKNPSYMRGKGWAVVVG